MSTFFFLLAFYVRKFYYNYKGKDEVSRWIGKSAGPRWRSFWARRWGLITRSQCMILPGRSPGFWPWSIPRSAAGPRTLPQATWPWTSGTAGPLRALTAGPATGACPPPARRCAAPPFSSRTTGMRCGGCCASTLPPAGTIPLPARSPPFWRRPAASPPPTPKRRWSFSPPRWSRSLNGCRTGSSAAPAVPPV